jgi:hypothetical protein
MVIINSAIGESAKALNAYSCSQELAHIASCLPFFGNFKDNSLLIHFDGAAKRFKLFKLFIFIKEKSNPLNIVGT